MGRAAPVTLLVALSALGCGWLGGKAAKPGARSDGSPVELWARDDHPRLGLVARDGDPSPAVAVAAVHDFGAVASAWLAALIEERLGAPEPNALRPVVSSHGFVVPRRAASEADASRIALGMASALRGPVSAAEAARLFERRAASISVRRYSGAADAAVGECVGELGDTDPSRRATAGDLERWRDAVATAHNASFAAVGPRGVIDAVADALSEAPAWPTRSAAGDPWPPGDVVGSGPGGATAGVLSVALRVADASRAVETARRLGDPASPLVAHVAALEPSWQVERVIGTVRPRGACLRVDLRIDPDAPPPSGRLVAGVSALVLEEAARALAETSSDPFSLDHAILEAEDPARAAGIAAWRALGGRLAPGPPRSFVSFGERAGHPVDLARSLPEARAARLRPSVELRSSAEPGQGETWLLLGSPCATATESARSAGAAALVVRALARHARGRPSGVEVDPWVSPDGIGLIVHGARLSADESAERHAERLGDALGRLFATVRVSDEAAAQVRADLQGELSPETEPLWPAAAAALSPERPSLLDPRGTWQSITELSTHGVEVERRALVRGPLRLAALVNGAPSHASVAERALERWLRPEREDAARCPPTEPVVPRPGAYAVPAPSGSRGTHALVGVPVSPSPFGGLPEEARWSVELLNGPGGWLERAVNVPELAVHAEARLFGGPLGGAILVEIAASEHKVRDAAEQVRALFVRLAEGAATADEVARARGAALVATKAALLDPRQRLVELWLGRPEAPVPDLSSLRRFHRQTFAEERHVVILTKARP